MNCIGKKLKQIMNIEDQGKRHRKLEILAKKVGASILQYRGNGRGYVTADETELVARIREVERTNNTKCASIAAVAAAIIALFSAIAAWLAVYVQSK